MNLFSLWFRKQYARWQARQIVKLYAEKEWLQDKAKTLSGSSKSDMTKMNAVKHLLEVNQAKIDRYMR